MERRLLGAVLSLCGLAAAVACRGTPPLGSRTFTSGTAFVGVGVVSMDRDTVAADQTVVVEDGRLQFVGPSASVSLGVQVESIDGHGRYLMPGLIDAHVHITRLEDLSAYVAAGVTTVRNMWGNPPATSWRDQIRAGEIVGPEIYTSGPIVDGDPPWFEGSVALTDASQAAALVDTHIASGYDFVKVLPGVGGEVYDALLAAANDRGIPVDGHVPHSRTLAQTLAAGQRGFEHLYGFAAALMHERPEVVDEKVWMLAWDDLDDSGIGEVVEAVRNAGAWVTPTLYVVDRRVFTADEVEARVALARRNYVHQAYIEMWTSERPWPPEIAASVRRGMQQRMKLVKALREAGVPVLAGTDSPNPFAPQGFALAGEIEMLVEAGLSPFQALEAATVVPARLMGKQADLGPLRAGRRADLLLLDANPLANVSARREIGGVMLRGTWHPAEALRDLLAAMPAERGARAGQ